MTPAQFEKLALALEGVETRPHMGRTAFRTPRRTFATLGTDGRVNLPIQPAEQRDALIEELPETFFDLGGWTRSMGWVGVDLRTVDAALLRTLLDEAWRDAQPAPSKKKTKASTPTKKKKKKTTARKR